MKIPLSMMLSIQTALGILGSILLLSAIAQGSELGNRIFVTVDAPDGFFSGTNGIITALAEDSRGFLWFGTQAGLTRYDGYRFKRYYHDPQDMSSISGDYVRTICVASDGRLWIGTISDGVSIFDPTTGLFERIVCKESPSDNFSDNRVDAIIRDGKDGLWIGTDNGLYRQEHGIDNPKRWGNLAGQTGNLNDQHIRSLLLDRNAPKRTAPFRSSSQTLYSV